MASKITRPAKRFKPNKTSIEPNRDKEEEGTAKDIEDLAYFTEDEMTDIRSKLLVWYDENHRILPWRRNQHSKVLPSKDDLFKSANFDLPQQQFVYYVWVSEVMSQQTQVPRAAAYFAKWVKKWPDVQALSRATIEEVNEAWAGLGYYRRAKFLLEGARFIVEKQNGMFPKTSSELQAIPGVGGYTSAAIASISLGERIAVVDANVMRILARLRCLDWDLKNVKQYGKLANALVDPHRPGDFNQAVMELGASICTIHQAPNCKNCPIQTHCHALEQVTSHSDKGLVTAGSEIPSVTDYPLKAVKAKRKEETAAVCVVEFIDESSGVSHILLAKRPSDGLLAGLWEMPLQIVGKDDSAERNKETMTQYLYKTLDLPLNSLHTLERKPLGQVIHIFSHIRLTLKIEKLALKGRIDLSAREEISGKRPATKWIEVRNFQSVGLSSSVQKVFKLFSKQQTQERTTIKRFFGKKSSLLS